MFYQDHKILSLLFPHHTAHKSSLTKCSCSIDSSRLQLPLSSCIFCCRNHLHGLCNFLNVLDGLQTPGNYKVNSWRSWAVLGIMTSKTRNKMLAIAIQKYLAKSLEEKKIINKQCTNKPHKGHVLTIYSKKAVRVVNQMQLYNRYGVFFPLRHNIYLIFSPM